MKLKSTLLSWRWWLGLHPLQVVQPPPQLTITAIVPAYNEAEHIAATIQSLLQQTYKLDAIIVVDDCSNDGTGDTASQFAGVEVVRTPENKGTKSQAQNYALDLVATDLFITIDGDTILAPDAVYEAMRFFNDTRAEVVCGNVVPQVRRTFWERGRLVEYLYAQTIMKPAQNHHGLVLVASGCFSIFRTATVQELGGFDERTMAEDMDLTWEIQDKGGRVYFAPKAVCYPVDPPTARIYVNQMDRWYRGFMQNVKVRRFRLFPQKRAMAYMVYAYLIWFAISALLVPGFVFAATGNIPLALLWILGVNVLFVWLPALVPAIKLGVWREIFPGFLAYLIIPYVNLFIYIRAAVMEFVLNRPLETWKKGH